MIRLGEYVVETTNDGRTLLSSPYIPDKIEIPSLPELITHHLQQTYYRDIYGFVLMFERAFCDDPNQLFGEVNDDNRDLEFLKHIPFDFPEALKITDREERFLSLVSSYLAIFNRRNTIKLKIEEVLPFLDKYRTWNY